VQSPIPNADSKGAKFHGCGRSLHNGCPARRTQDKQIPRSWLVASRTIAVLLQDLDTEA
jgi:hypothetical protein